MWSLRALYDGVHPATDAKGAPWPPLSQEAARAGKPLAGGYRGVVWLLKGDLEYFANSLHLNHYASRSPCFLCKAGCDAAAPWTDPRQTAAWRATCHTKDVWTAAYTPHPHATLTTPDPAPLSAGPENLSRTDPCRPRAGVSLADLSDPVALLGLRPWAKGLGQHKA